MSQQAVIYLRVSTTAQADKDLDAEGYSIPAQREACLRKAETLGAVVIDEYVDRGESARSADRPALQSMLDRLRGRDIDYVIVHKVDRLARNRHDDVGISMLIHQAGATLVSASENIDQTPSGRLLHGIMASMAEFYSANLGTEALKGMTQKAKKGGTPGRAPIGYRNVGQAIDVKEIRTIDIDPERAPHVQWAFDAYSTGDWTMRQLCEELERRGLRSVPIGNKPAQALTLSRITKLLRDRYYIGIVTFNGVEYPGRHEPLVGVETFDRVQAIAASRYQRGIRYRVHTHYLKGTIHCGRCGGRLSFTRATGKGGTYDYFYCLGRKRRAVECQQPHLPVAAVEEGVTDYYRNIQLEDHRIAKLRAELAVAMTRASSQAQGERSRQQDRLRALEGERRKLLQAHYAGAVPIELLKEEQNRIAAETTQAQQALAAAETQFVQVENLLARAITLAADCHAAYRESGPNVRRLYNQAFFEKLYIVDQTVTAADLAEPFAELLEHDLLDRIQRELSTTTTNPDAYMRRGLNSVLLARPEGLEPPTF